MRGQQADRHHGEDMVDAADRMHEAMGKTANVTDAGMGKGRTRQRSACKRQGRQFQSCSHVPSPSGRNPAPAAGDWR
jgi:hypothetical protein